MKREEGGGGLGGGGRRDMEVKEEEAVLEVVKVREVKCRGQLPSPLLTMEIAWTRSQKLWTESAIIAPQAAAAAAFKK